MRNSFNARVGYLSLFFLLILFFPQQNLIGQCPTGTLSGTVFVDQDLDGVNDSSEGGFANLLVRAFDAAGTQQGQDVTDNSGSYNISGLPNGQSFRLEFTVTGGALVSTPGPNNGGDVQFVTCLLYTSPSPRDRG